MTMVIDLSEKIAEEEFQRWLEADPANVATCARLDALKEAEAAAEDDAAREAIVDEAAELLTAILESFSPRSQAYLLQSIEEDEPPLAT